MIEVELKVYQYSKYYYIKGTEILHREEGPAVESVDGVKEWYYYGKRHRLDGPAVEFADDTSWWFIDGEKINCVSQQQFEKLLKLKTFW